MSARLGHLTLDTVDLDRAVAFWVAVFEGQVWRAPDGAIAVVSAPGTELMIQRVDSVASGKNPIHLDLFTADLDSELPRLEALGAREVARYAQWERSGPPSSTRTDTSSMSSSAPNPPERRDLPPARGVRDAHRRGRVRSCPACFDP